MPTVYRDMAHKAKSGSIGRGLERGNLTLTTTDATATNVLSVPVAELQHVAIRVLASSAKSDYTDGLSGQIICGAHRPTAGNVETDGSANVVTVEDSAGSPLLSFAVNTSAQTAEVKLTGVAAETWKHEIHFEVLYS